MQAGKPTPTGGRQGLPTLILLLMTVGFVLAGGWPMGGTGFLAGAEPTRLPVLLVPGWGDTASELAPLRQRFLDAGWPPEAVMALDFGDPVGSNAQHSAEVKEAVERLRVEGDSQEVDVVAHSMGGLALRHYLTVVDTLAPVRRAVFLATPHRGTMTAYLAWGDGGREMLPGSDFLLHLNRQSFPSRIQGLAIRTPVDLRIIPASSAILSEIRNLELCCPSHGSMLDDPGVFQRVQAFLLAP